MESSRHPLKNVVWVGRLVMSKMLMSVLRRGPLVTAQAFFSEFYFDFSRGTDTSGLISTERLSIPDSERGRANWYEGSSPYFFRKLISHLPKDCRDSVLLDYGCGKGRVLLMAIEAGFRKAIGIELDPKLSKIAQANAAKVLGPDFRGRIEIHEGNAAEFEVPDEVDVIYLFNPFKTEILRMIMRKLEASRKRRHRRFWIVYLSKANAELFQEFGCAKKASVGKQGGREGSIYEF